jgi:N utilization substance protein B
VTDVPAPTTKPKSARRRSRELALQLLYGWLLNPTDAASLKRAARQDANFARVDARLFDSVVDDVVAHAEELRARVAPHLDRAVGALSPVEHVILLIAGSELAFHPDTPYRVVINEAVELAKTFGGTDGHKYVNGVLDRLAAELRPAEVR